MRKQLLFSTRAALTLFLSVSMMTTAWAQENTTEVIGGYTFTKDANNNYLIQSIDDWNGLADAVAAGTDCAGKTFLMTANIGTAEAPVTKALGRQTTTQKNSRKRFAGNFDGGNHELYVDLNSQTVKSADDWFYYCRSYCSPFAYTKNITVKNLHVVGTITASGQFASGLIGSTGNKAEDGACTIQNCQISVEMKTNYVTNGSAFPNHGGLIGVAEGSATISDSWFDGKIIAEDYRHSGGFIGLNKGTGTTISNCLFNPSEFSVKDNLTANACEFAHSLNGGKHTLTNDYWVTACGDAQNTQRLDATQGTTTISYDNFTQEEVKAVNGATYYYYTLALADEEDDIDDVLSAANDLECSVTLQGRTLYKDGDWNTLCLPFDVPNIVDTPLEGAIIKTLDGKNSSLDKDGYLTLTFGKSVEALEAGVPYIVKWEKAGDNVVNPEFKNVTLNSDVSTVVKSTDGNVWFVGNFAKFEIVESANGDNQGNLDETILLASGSKLGYSKKNRTVNCFRAHFYVPASSNSNKVKSYVLNFDDEEESTGIFDIIEQNSKQDNVWYSLDGRKVAQPTKGIYIRNGKKVMVK